MVIYEVFQGIMRNTDMLSERRQKEVEFACINQHPDIRLADF
jgi:hypothetical protein